MLCCQTGETALMHFICKRLSRCLRDDMALALSNGSFGLFDGGEHFRAAALALFPQRHGFFSRSLSIIDAARRDSGADESFLVGSWTNFHKIKLILHVK